LPFGSDHSRATQKTSGHKALSRVARPSPFQGGRVAERQEAAPCVFQSKFAHRMHEDLEATGGECGAWLFSKKRRTNWLKMRPIEK
jgi:hypothetical protein